MRPSHPRSQRTTLAHTTEIFRWDQGKWFY
jgi:hypothetical protein